MNIKSFCAIFWGTFGGKRAVQKRCYASGFFSDLLVYDTGNKPSLGLLR